MHPCVTLQIVKGRRGEDCFHLPLFGLHPHGIFAYGRVLSRVVLLLVTCVCEAQWKDCEAGRLRPWRYALRRGDCAVWGAGEPKSSHLFILPNVP